VIYLTLFWPSSRLNADLFACLSVMLPAQHDSAAGRWYLAKQRGVKPAWPHRVGGGWPHPGALEVLPEVPAPPATRPREEVVDELVAKR